MMDTIMMEPRSKRLKAASSETHDRLDKRIMAGAPFASRANYVRFLVVQQAFHRDIDALYAAPSLAALLPDLEERRRLSAILQDLFDLDAKLEVALPPLFAVADMQGVDVPTALGWLYVAEGSNLGAAFLFKMAAALGLGAEFGARHLAGHPDGRARHWRTFTAVLDTVPMDAASEGRMEDAARAAFSRVHTLVDIHFS